MTRFITIFFALLLILGAAGLKGCSPDSKEKTIIQPLTETGVFDPVIKSETDTPDSEEEKNTQETEEETDTEKEDQEEESEKDDQSEDSETEENTKESKASASTGGDLFDVYNGYGGGINLLSPQEEINFALNQNSVESNFWKTKVSKPAIVVHNPRDAKRKTPKISTEEKPEEEAKNSEEEEEEPTTEKSTSTAKEPEYKTETKDNQKAQRPDSLEVKPNTFHTRVYIYDNAINMSQRTLPAGPVTFTISNLGNFSHIFIIPGTGTALKVLPGKTVVTNTNLLAGNYTIMSDKSYEKNIEFIGEYSEKRQEMEKRVSTSITVQ